MTNSNGDWRGGEGGGEIIIIAFAGWAIKWGEEVGNGVVYFLTKYEGEGKIVF